MEFEEEGIAEVSPDGRFIRYDEIIAKNTYKVVYKGFDEIDGIEIAWNQMSVSDDVSNSSESRERLLSEAALVKLLKHVNITKCYHSWVDKENNNINLITELFTSGNLTQFRRKHTHVDMKAIKNWGRQILKGLHYLHSQNPPIVHRDLTCENLFVNGSPAEVKIGDLGFAAILRQGTALSVVGTPEFMAPEIFYDEYNELVDIYAFGICMLELVTCECPYRECTNAGQVYKKVVSGVKPDALGKVKDPKAREFIEKCLLPAAQRVPAIELLNDPFLSSEKPKDVVSLILPKLETSGGENMDVDENTPGCSECSNFSKVRKYRLRGKKMDENSISFILWVTGSSKCTFRFVFNLDADTALSVARELAELELDQAKFELDDVVPVTKLMDTLILEFVPTWKPSNLNGLKKFSSVGESVTFSEFTKKSEALFARSISSVSNDSNRSMSSTETLDEKDHLDWLKLELDAIDSEFKQCCRKLMKMREEAVENAKRRWTASRRVAMA